MDLDKGIQAGTAIGITILAVDSFPKYLPSVSEVRKAKPGDVDIRADVHAGELLAGIAIGTVSALAASVTNSGVPILIGGIAFLTMFATYEWLLRAPKPFNG